MKKYKLKPGRHQFAPGEHAWHSNETLTDAEAAWYLERYPHIRHLFSDSPDPDNYKDEKPESPEKKKTKRKRIGGITKIPVKSQNNENLSTTN